MKIFSLIFLSLFVIGCSTAPTQTVVQPVIDTVETVKVVPCKVDGFTCDFNGEAYIPTFKLFKCVIAQKKIIEICSGKNNNVPFTASPEQIKEYIDKELESVDQTFNVK